jgi:hypothetical protein
MPRSPNSATSATVSDGIHSVSVLGCEPAGVAAADAESAATSGALPLTRRPSRSATSTALAVRASVTSPSTPAASVRAMKSTKADAR